MIEGKTILRIEERPLDEYGSPDYGALVIHFTDGSALRLEGRSYEDVDLSFNEMTATDVRRAAFRRMGQREVRRQERLKRLEWLSITCEERAQRRERARERERRQSSPFANILNEQYSAILADQMRALSILGFGQEPQTIRKKCARCGEVECENATVEVIAPRPVPHGGYKAVFNWK